MTERWLTAKQVAEKIGRAAGTLARDRSHGRGLPYYKLGSKSIRYKESDVDEYMEERCERVVPRRGLCRGGG
jgi:predicted DNA-binding transcriptional regulator AlpA